MGRPTHYYQDSEIDRLLFGVKRCTICGQEKAANLEQFARDVDKPDGLTYSCRRCRNAREVDLRKMREAKTACDA